MPTQPFYLLIAEDDPDDVFMLESVLAEQCPDWRYRFVSDGTELLRHLQQVGMRPEAALPSMILLDINMPRKNGLEALAELRQLPACQRVPVVGFSTSADSQTVQRFMALNGNRYLQKPDSYEALVQLIAFLRDYAHALPPQAQPAPALGHTAPVFHQIYRSGAAGR